MSCQVMGSVFDYGLVLKTIIFRAYDEKSFKIVSLRITG